MIKDNKKDHLLRSFLDSLYIEKGLSQNTISSYKNDISSFSSWCDKELLDLLKITDLNLNNYISNLFSIGLKSSSINRKISSIKHFYLFLLKKKVIKSSSRWNSYSKTRKIFTNINVWRWSWVPFRKSKI